MRRLAVSMVCLVLVLVLGACGSDKKEVTTAPTTTTAVATTTAETAAPTTPLPSSPTTLPDVTETTVGCPNTGTTNPRDSGAHSAALLTEVAVTNVACRDSVTFTFRKSGVDSPSCKLEYRDGPFTKDPSDQPVPVAGTAFLLVRCEPAYGYDFANDGKPTYTGPKRITATGTRHVREVVETGDFEAVLQWVIGLDAKRAFAISAGGTPERQLIVTFS